MPLGVLCLQETSEDGKPLFPCVGDVGTLSEVKCTILVPGPNAMVTHIPYDIISRKSWRLWSLPSSNEPFWWILPNSPAQRVPLPLWSPTTYSHLLAAQQHGLGAWGRLEAVGGVRSALALLWTARGIWLGCGIPQPAPVQNRPAMRVFSPS